MGGKENLTRGRWGAVGGGGKEEGPRAEALGRGGGFGCGARVVGGGVVNTRIARGLVGRGNWGEGLTRARGKAGVGRMQNSPLWRPVHGCSAARVLAGAAQPVAASL